MRHLSLQQWVGHADPSINTHRIEFRARVGDHGVDHILGLKHKGEEIGGAHEAGRAIAFTSSGRQIGERAGWEERVERGRREKGGRAGRERRGGKGQRMRR